MMASQLSLQFSSQFRQQESSETLLIDPTQSSSPESSQSIVSPQEAKVRDWEDHGRYSPRAVVACHLGQLAIRGDFHQLPDRSLHQAPLHYRQANGLSNHSNSHGPHGVHDMPDSVSSTAIERHYSPSEKHAPDTTADGQSQLEIPETPVNRSRQKNSISPRKKRTTPSPTKARSSTGSPTLSSDVKENALTWNDSEITGHNPTDPDDDGYGINGIGFKPTAAIAWARSQKRKKQVSEWRNREAREAREKRRERRVANDLDKLRTVQSGGIQKKVKFDV
ncbi:uncharacterized protein BDV17DRAFT_23770 [Aspergillus undulatus]|uniref:uncharacterized protein n=1 Tax=Aspergillus undulatus TaxID=1810928 RepID=UPI003CCD44A2